MTERSDAPRPIPAPSDLQATVHPLYAVPMMHCHLPQAERINHELVELFLRLEAEGGRHRDPLARDTQHGIFESNFALHERTEPCVRELFAFAGASLRCLVRNLNQYDDQQMSTIALDIHSWFHVTRTGGFQSSHNHPNASWSAIYCVDPGDSDAPESGAVRFHDPRCGSNMYRDPANDRLQDPYRLGAWELHHRPGQMLVFPSYLIHEIFPYTGNRPRIVVALNAWCRRTPLPPPGGAAPRS